MIKLEQLQPGAAVRGIVPDAMVVVVSVQWFGSEALELTYKTPAGKVANELLYRRFHLPFEILTNDKLEAARTGNWFQETNLVIARLDKLSRNESVQHKLQAPDCGWDLVVCDEAHKMSATVFGGEIKYTKRIAETLIGLESLALGVRNSGTDTKWRELASLLREIFTIGAGADRGVAPAIPEGADNIPPPKPSPHQKLVLFTEHRDTLNYLEARITTLLGRKVAVVIIHGSMGREERVIAQESFKYDPDVRVLLATDAAGEGINLQRAHLMVNYDLPWNPNRLEQRFGRIHRIGQTEVCHLWNLVADETREGDVYRKLLDKLEEARKALGGHVFDVLGKLQFEGRSLRELLIEAIRYGDQADVRARLTTVLENVLDRGHLRDLLEERALAHDAMDASRVHRIREDMERAEARRLQPHYIESFTGRWPRANRVWRQSSTGLSARGLTARSRRRRRATRSPRSCRSTSRRCGTASSRSSPRRKWR